MLDGFNIQSLPVGDWRQFLILAVGVLVVGGGGYIAWRRLRRQPTHKLTGDIAVVLATAFAAEGMWEVARESLHLHWHIAAGLFAMFEVVMVNQALVAKHKLNGPKPKTARRHMTFVWLIAAASGAIASLNSANLPEFALRLLAPSVAAGIWWTSLTVDRDDTEMEESSWRWTPRRFGLWIGAIEPGDRDLVEVDRERHITQMVEARVKLLDGARWAGRWSGKLRKLAVEATADMVAEVQERVARVHRIVDLTGPDFRAEVPPPGEAELPGGTCDEVPAEGPGGSSGRKRGGTSGRNNGRRGGGTSGRNNGHGRGGTSGTRRSAVESRELIAEILAQDPAITQKALAQKLGISDRRLRDIQVNGSDLASATETPTN